MEQALCRFPFVLGQILDRLQIQPDSRVDNDHHLGALAFNRYSLLLPPLLDQCLVNQKGVACCVIFTCITVLIYGSDRRSSHGWRLSPIGHCPVSPSSHSLRGWRRGRDVLWVFHCP